MAHTNYVLPVGNQELVHFDSVVVPAQSVRDLCGSVNFFSRKKGNRGSRSPVHRYQDAVGDVDGFLLIAVWELQALLDAGVRLYFERNVSDPVGLAAYMHLLGVMYQAGLVHEQEDRYF